MNRVGLIGGHGFIGQHIFQKLSKRKCKIKCFVRKIKKEDLKKRKNVKYKQINNIYLLPKTKLKKLFKGIDILIHTAWFTRPGEYLDSEENIKCLKGIIKIASAFAEAGGKKFVGLGSCAEYRPCSHPLSTQSKLEPTSLYGSCKVSAFLILSKLLSLKKIKFAWCRLFFLYGEGEKTDRLVPFIRKQLSEGKVVRLSAGNLIRDYLNVKKAAQKIVKVALGPYTGAINICSGCPISIQKFAEKIASTQKNKNLLRFCRNNKINNLPKFIVGIKSI